MRWSEIEEKPYGKGGVEYRQRCLEPIVLIDWGNYDHKVNMMKVTLYQKSLNGFVRTRFTAEGMGGKDWRDVAEEPFKIHQRWMWCPENDVPKAISELRKYFLERIEKNEKDYISTKQRMNDLLSELDILQDKMEGE